MSMDRVIVQVPMPKTLKESAQAAALDAGFSSLQEVIRIFTRKFATGGITVSFDETIRLSPLSRKRYAKIDQDFRQGKDIYTATNLSDLKTRLHEDLLP